MMHPNANRLISKRLQETADNEYAFLFPGVEEGNAFQQALAKTNPFQYFSIDEEWRGSVLSITMIGPLLNTALWRKLASMAKRFKGKVDPRRANPMTEKDVPRYRTAISRSKISVPVRLALKKGALQPGMTVFDYGAGRGFDTKALQDMGYDANGWDPHWASGNPKVPSDIVFINYVLNVIEDPAERAKTLKDAWRLARHGMVVAVRTVGEANVAKFEPFGDGYITSTGTFQKFFAPGEASQYAASVIGKGGVKLGRGIIFISR